MRDQFKITLSAALALIVMVGVSVYTISERNAGSRVSSVSLNYERGGDGVTGDEPQETIKVTFDKNGGERVSPESKKVTTGEAYGALPTPIWSEHTFEGWFTAATGNATYTVTISLKNGCAWFDGTTDDLPFTWHITSAVTKYTITAPATRPGSGS